VGANGAVALHFQNFAAQPRQNLMVIDEQNGLHYDLLLGT
jgi:hypothetical protein